MEITVHCFNVGVVFASAVNIESTVSTGASEYGGCCVYAASLGASGHPVYAFNYHFVTSLFKIAFCLSAAACFIDANNAGALCCFAAVGAHAVTVVDKIAAVIASRQICFAHCFASATKYDGGLGI